MRKVSVNNFTKGMQKDLDKSLQTPDTYLHAENFRIVATTEGTSGALENIKGNLEIHNFSGKTIVGSCSVRNELIIFTKDYNNLGYVYVANVDADGKFLTTNLVYSNSLFTLGEKVECVGRYENDYIRKVYFTDEVNNVRFFNYTDPNLHNLLPDRFDFIQKVTFTNVVLDNITTGSLKTGKVSYVYKLYNLYGGESLFSSPCEPYHVTSESEFISSGEKYKGVAKDTVTTKGYAIKIPYDSTFQYFNKLELVAIHYGSYNGVPEIRILERINLHYSSTDILNNYSIVYDIGQSLGSYSLDELTVMTTSIFNARTLATKNNYLFAGNITENYFDVDNYDTRAYRFEVSYGPIMYSVLWNTDTTGIYLFYDKTTGIKSTDAFKIVGSAVRDDAMNLILDTLAATMGKTRDNYWVVPEDYNCLNYHNNTAYDWNGVDPLGKDNKYKASSNTLTYGGEGNNVSYTFKVNPRPFNNSNSLKTYYTNKKTGVIDYLENKSVYTDYSSPWYNNYRSFLRDEIYRTYVVLTDAYGRDSFPKWIGDIRMPANTDTSSVEIYNILGLSKTDFRFTYSIGTDTYYNPINLEFSFKNIPTGIKSLKITYVPRSEKDKTIIGQGVLQQAFKWGGTDELYRPVRGAGGGNLFSNAVCFISPEINVLNTIHYSTEDYFKKVEDLDVTQIALDKSSGISTNLFPQLYVYDREGSSEIAYSKIADFNIIPVATSNLNPVSLKDKDGVNIGVINDIRDNMSTANRGLGGTRGVATIKDSIASTVAGALVNYKRDIYQSQYDGNSYNVRQNNLSIQCSPIVSITTNNTTTVIAHGDTYISTFDYLDSMYDLSIDQTNWKIEFDYFPVETSINLNMRLDDSLHRIYYNDDSIFLKETAGKHLRSSSLDANKDSSYFIQTTDLYAYNDVYSKMNSIKEFTPKPVDWRTQRSFDTMVKYSEKKLNGEDIDSWSIFKSANYIEVDSSNGPLTNLLTFNNYLYFWQPDGFGNLSVNPRAMITDSTGMELTLGTGGVLERYDYFSTGLGCSLYNTVINSNFGLYWYDNNNKDIYKFSTDEQPLSKLKGVRTLLNNLNSVYDCITVNDKSNNEILMSIKSTTKEEVVTCSKVTRHNSGFYLYIIHNTWDIQIGDIVMIDRYGVVYPTKVVGVTPDPVEPTNMLTLYSDNQMGLVLDGPPTTISAYAKCNNTTIVYNEFADAFTAIYTYRPSIYLTINNIFYSATNVGKIWQHNIGERATFYNTTYPSSLRVLVNSEYVETKTFDNISLFSVSQDSNGTNQLYDTFNTIRVYNDYQNSDYIDLIPGDPTSLVRKERSFSLQVPRNAVIGSVLDNINIFDSTNLSTLKDFAERMRDKYMIIDLTYNNTNNYKFNIPYVNTYYRTSIR